jgi:hypothetical protein
MAKAAYLMDFQAQAKRLALRGGSWNNNQENARVSIRNNNHPDNRNNNIGFRVAAFHRFPSPCRKYALIMVRHRGKTGWPVARSWTGKCISTPNIKNPRLFQ